MLYRVSTIFYSYAEYQRFLIKGNKDVLYFPWPSFIYRFFFQKKSKTKQDVLQLWLNKTDSRPSEGPIRSNFDVKGFKLLKMNMKSGHSEDTRVIFGLSACLRQMVFVPGQT